MTPARYRALLREGRALLRAHDDFCRSNGLTEPRSERERVEAVHEWVRQTAASRKPASPD